MLRVSGHSERTDVGRQRQANEDSYMARAPLFVVADGMGGAQAGEVASLTAIQAFQAGLPEGSPEAAIEQTIGVANRNIYEQAHADPSLSGMGTTITVAAVDSDSEQVIIGHVGDSRAYRLRDGIIQRLTKDHSLVEEMRRRGQITEEQAEDHPQRSIITRALGPEPEVQADLTAVPSEPGDIFLLCSDGLTTMIGDEKIRDILMGATSLDAAARTLVDEANRAGGRDNITVIVFQVEDPARPLPKGEQPTMIRRGGAARGASRRAAGRRRGDGETALRVAAAGASPSRSPGWQRSSCSRPARPGTRSASPGSSAPTRPAGSPSTAGYPTSCPSGSSSTSSSTRPRSRPVHCRRAVSARSPTTRSAPRMTRFR